MDRRTPAEKAEAFLDPTGDQLHVYDQIKEIEAGGVDMTEFITGVLRFPDRDAFEWDAEDFVFMAADIYDWIEAIEDPADREADA